MFKEDRKIIKSEDHQIISNIIEITMLAMHQGYGFSEQNLCNIFYSQGFLNYVIESSKVYCFSGSLSITEDKKKFSFVAEIGDKDENVGRVHIGLINGSNSIYDIEISINGQLRIFNFVLVNGRLELIDGYEELKKYEDGSIIAENNKNNQAFTK